MCVCNVSLYVSYLDYPVSVTSEPFRTVHKRRVGQESRLMYALAAGCPRPLWHRPCRAARVGSKVACRQEARRLVQCSQSVLRVTARIELKDMAQPTSCARLSSSSRRCARPSRY